MCICILLKLDMGHTSAQHFTVKTNSRPSFLIHTREVWGFRAMGSTLPPFMPSPFYYFSVWQTGTTLESLQHSSEVSC